MFNPKDNVHFDPILMNQHLVLHLPSFKRGEGGSLNQTLMCIVICNTVENIKDKSVYERAGFSDESVFSQEEHYPQQNGRAERLLDGK